MNYTLLFGLAFLGSVVGLIGGLLLIINKKWAKIVSTYSIAFAAGVLIAVSLADLLPEAVHQLGETAYLYVLLAFLAGFLLEQWLDHFHHHDHTIGDKEPNTPGKRSTLVPLIVLGDTIHNFIDGVTIAAAYLANPGLGFTVAVSTLLHEIPHEVGDFGIMLHAGYSKVRVVLINFLSALSTFVGVALVLIFSEQAEQLLGVFLAVAAGMFIYIAGTDLLPKVTKSDSNRLAKTIVLFLGVLIMMVVGLIIPHSHDLDTENHLDEVQDTLYHDD